MPGLFLSSCCPPVTGPKIANFIENELKLAWWRIYFVTFAHLIMKWYKTYKIGPCLYREKNVIYRFSKCLVFRGGHLWTRGSSVQIRALRVSVKVFSYSTWCIETEKYEFSIQQVSRFRKNMLYRFQKWKNNGGTKFSYFLKMVVMVLI